MAANVVPAIGALPRLALYQRIELAAVNLATSQAPHIDATELALAGAFPIRLALKQSACGRRVERQSAPCVLTDLLTRFSAAAFLNRNQIVAFACRSVHAPQTETARGVSPEPFRSREWKVADDSRRTPIIPQRAASARAAWSSVQIPISLARVARS